MKKIKTTKKILCSLTLLSPLSGVLNNQYQNAQKTITESSNNSLSNYVRSNAEPVQMGDIYVNLDDTGKIIKSYASGNGKLKLTSDIEQIGWIAFQSNQNITSLDLSNATSLTSIDNQAFDHCKNLKGNIVIPSKVTRIGGSAFDTSGIEGLDLSKADNLLIISDESFYNCSSLSGTITFPAHLTVIENTSFNETSVNTLDFSKATDLYSIGNNAFYNNTKLKKIKFASNGNLTNIGMFAFEGCKNLSGNITFPERIQTINSSAFVGTTLDNITFLSETPPSFGNNWQPTVTGKVYIPKGTEDIYLSSVNFGFDKDQIAIGTGPKETGNTSLILELSLGLGIPAIVIVTLVITYYFKKHKELNKKNK